MLDKLEGKLTISRPSGFDADFIRIELVDNVASAIAVVIEIPLDKFAETLTGLAHTFDDARAALHQNEQSLTRELLDVLKAAREELRLLRMKDTPVVYEPTLRSRMDNVIDKAERRSSCVFDFNDSGVIGTKHENKEEMVPIPAYESRDKEGKWIDEALAPFLVDGWYARISDMKNHHRHVRIKDGKEFQRVVFYRNIPKEQGK